MLMLSGGNEAETYYMMNSMFSEYSLDSIFAHDMSGLKKFLFIFDKIFSKKLPALAAHFKEQEVSEHAWIGRWVLTLFVNCLPNAVVIRIWDCILVKGWRYVYRIALGILSRLKELLMDLDGIEI